MNKIIVFILFLVMSSCDKPQVKENRVSDYFSSRISSVLNKKNKVILNIEFTNLTDKSIFVYAQGKATKSVSMYSLNYLGKRYVYPKEFIELKFDPKEKKILTYEFTLAPEFIIKTGVAQQTVFSSSFSRLLINNLEVEFLREEDSILEAIK